MYLITDLIVVFIYFVLPMLLLFSFFYWFWFKKYRSKSKSISLIKEASKYLLVVYFVYIAYFCWFSYGIPSESLKYNLIPFHTIWSYIKEIQIGMIRGVALWNLLGNILLSVPFGLLVKLIFRKATFKKVFFSSVIFSIVIEFGQFVLFFTHISNRTVDIDDVILNTLGGMLGYYLGNVFWSYADGIKSRITQVQSQECK
ncbi:VanZ family protein [Alkalihalobacillus sp. 1P02AB]|uniref:VanZ family protein n=1 Tax=Alkalihalobacillus sp. 1P02AB TaxID=3132260 RepID=UPI0039A4CFC6